MKLMYVCLLFLLYDSLYAYGPIKASNPLPSDIMTPTFPLGSCKMATLPSVPYFFSSIVNEADRTCFTINTTPNWKSICGALPCQNMLTNLVKIVFSIRQNTECGILTNYTNSRKSNTMFPWLINGKLASIYSIISRSSSTPHLSGDVVLYKWRGTVKGKLIEGVQIDVKSSSGMLKRNDTTLDGYRLCLSKLIPKVIPECLLNPTNLLRYSFYDPNKSLCSAGVVAGP